MGAMSLCAVACAAALATMPPPADTAAKDKTYGTRLGSHSMLYLNHTAVQQKALLRASSEAGLRYLRMDFAVGIVFASGGTDFSAVERVNALAARYRIRVVGTITDTPWYIAECPAGRSELPGRCAPAPQHESTWRDMVTQIVRHAPNVRRWELGNEPDNGFGFVGTPSDYARWATLAALGVRAAQPDATIAVGGFSRLNTTYIDAVLHDAANPLIEHVVVANVHLRGRLHGLRHAVRRAKAFYRRTGLPGPLWVTETGYPSLAAHQDQPRMKGGPSDQARWIACGARFMIDAGADAVFVAFRDNPEFPPDSAFASEGVVRWPRLTADGRPYPKPAFQALRALAARRLGDRPTRLGSRHACRATARPAQGSRRQQLRARDRRGLGR